MLSLGFTILAPDLSANAPALLCIRVVVQKEKTLGVVAIHLQLGEFFKIPSTLQQSLLNEAERLRANGILKGSTKFFRLKREAGIKTRARGRLSLKQYKH